MIPQFPKFKPIELSDKEEVEGFNDKFPPYSDFNFISLWSWNLKGEMKLSILNENLVVHFTDYLSGDSFYSFLGDKKVDETASALLDFSVKKKFRSKLHLIPEVVASKLDKNKFIVEEDRDNFDYIYDANLLAEYKGGEFTEKRRNVNLFLRNFPNSQTESLDFNNPKTELDILKLDEEWLKDKLKKDSDYQYNQNESIAIDNFFQSKIKNSVGVGIFYDKKLIGYSISEILPNGYSISHFLKADTHFKGIYDYVSKESAKKLRDKGVSFINYEQDLGIKGLRQAKSSFKPVNFLKKFICAYK